jgi:hypothetical protein
MGEAFTLGTITLVSGNIGNYFCTDMFNGCSGSGFTMSDDFTLPSGTVNNIGHYFCQGMFSGCGDEATDMFTMKNNFTMPLTVNGTVAPGFCQSMFANCKSNAFSMGTTFELPSGITTVGINFCADMFSGCSGSGFQVNDVFKFPALDQTEVDRSGVFSYTFSGVTQWQEETDATTIINGTPEPSPGPSSPRHTFGGGVWPDYGDLPPNWK